MVAHPYPDILRQHPYHYKRNKRRPSEAEKCCHRGKMKGCEGSRKDPVNAISLRLTLRQCLAIRSRNRLLRILWTERRLHLHPDDPPGSLTAPSGRAACFVLVYLHQMRFPLGMVKGTPPRIRPQRPESPLPRLISAPRSSLLEQRDEGCSVLLKNG